MKIIQKVSLPLLFLVLFAACKNNDDNKRDIQLLPDSSAYNNSSSTDSIKMNSESTAKGTNSYRYHPDESRHQHVAEASTSGTRTVTSNPTSTNSGSTASQTTSTQSTKKKGWSKAAQGAVIGGAAGAVGGAIVSKHKGTGAAIGAALGAAGGYIIGRNKDKKDGR